MDLTVGTVPCDAYPDIEPGAVVQVTDGSGESVGQGTLGRSGARSYWTTFSVPVEFDEVYRIRIGEHERTLTQEELDRTRIAGHSGRPVLSWAIIGPG